MIFLTKIWKWKTTYPSLAVIASAIGYLLLGDVNSATDILLPIIAASIGLGSLFTRHAISKVEDKLK